MGIFKPTVWIGGTALLIRSLTCKPVELSSTPRIHVEVLGLVYLHCNTVLAIPVLGS